MQDYRDYEPGSSGGVAVREFQMQGGAADYVLFVGKKAVGVIEAKPEGTTLGGVDSQSGKYAASFPEQYPHCRAALALRLREHGGGDALPRSPGSRAAIASCLRIP